ncbi:MAG: restriction endonuclease subunit S [Lentimicrobium sp.]|jgi:type I restriction enzyme S subunit|nr:restriction endonuclease subunit S [Lentimicrobium sp.]
MSEWKKCKLVEYSNINMGQSPKSEYYNNEEIGIPFLQGNRTFGIKYPTYDTYCSQPLKFANEGEILFSVRAPVGDINIANRKICIGRGLAALNAKNGKNDFLYFLLHYLKSTIVNNESGSVFGAVNKFTLENIDILLPPLPEQTAIASILSSLDDKIDLLHRQNATLEKMAETLFRQWFVEEAKEEWKIGKLANEFDFTMGASPPGISYNEEGIGIPMYQGNADFGFRFPTNRVFTTDPKRFAEKYDTLISVRAPVGEQNMANEKCCIGRGVAAFRYKIDNSFYTYTYYKMKSLMDDIKQFNETGTVFGSISKSDFENIDIFIPDKISIYKFQNEAKPIDDKINTNTIQIRTLTALRDTLLPKLMSGEVRVEY